MRRRPHDRRPFRLPGLAALALVTVTVLTACGSGGDPAPAAPAAPSPAAPSPAAPGRTLTVVASTNVWGAVVSAVAGPGVEVRSLISDPAADPHSYESTPADAAAIAGADLVVWNGGGYDEFVQQAIGADPALAGKTVEAFTSRGDQADDDEHVWFDPAAVKGVVTQVTDRLAAVEPDQATALRERAAAFTGRVDQESAALAGIGAARPGSRVVSTEPIAHYLLRTAGVADVTPPAFSEAVEAEADPPAAALVQTRDLLTARGAGALVFNPQTETPLTEQLRATATGAGLPVVDVTETLPAGRDYLQWLDGNRTALAGALGAPA